MGIEAKRRRDVVRADGAPVQRDAGDFRCGPAEQNDLICNHVRRQGINIFVLSENKLAFSHHTYLMT